MSLLRILFPIYFLIAAGLTCAQSAPQPSGDIDEAQVNLLQLGAQRLQAGNPQEAIAEFDEVIAFYDSRYKDGDKKVYGARTQVEALSYLLTATMDKKSVIVVKPTWGNAIFAKAYALIELRRFEDAKILLERAISISPSNSQYLAELGHVHQTRKDWPQAMAAFTAAEEAASAYSPPEIKTKELTRAMRGIGFVLVELQRLDEAEAKYHKCLELDGGDTMASRELQYIQQLRAKGGTK